MVGIGMDRGYTEILHLDMCMPSCLPIPEDEVLVAIAAVIAAVIALVVVVAMECMACCSMLNRVDDGEDKEGRWVDGSMK